MNPDIFFTVAISADVWNTYYMEEIEPMLAKEINKVTVLYIMLLQEGINWL